MLRIIDNLWLNSLIGLFFILVITIINIVMSRRKTMPVILFDQLFFSTLMFVLFGYPCIIYSIVCLVLVIIKKYRDRYYSEYASLNYNSTIHSFSRIKNLLNSTKSGDVIVGNIVPTNHKQLKNNMKAIRVTDTILSGGMLLTGSTGSGKTSTMLSIIKQGIEKHKPVVFFDYKGETEILDKLQAFCKTLNVPYYEFSVRNCTFSYDPLKNLNETGKVEAILNTRRWSTDGADEHYKTSMQLAIQNLVSSYDEYRRQNNDEGNYIQGLYTYCGKYRPSQNDRDGFNTVVKMLEILLSSRAKDLFNNDKPEFTFQRNDCYVVCFSFVSANKALANSLSSFVFQDLMDRGTRKQYEPRLMLCVDEFGTLENSNIIKDILEKGRSGGIQTIFSILDINQIAMTTSMYFVNAILGTINSYIFHAGSTQQTAELLSGVQKYTLDFDIMSLQKPYNGNPPTALFISKYPILNKNGSQESYKIIPYSYRDKKRKEITSPTYTENPVVIEKVTNTSITQTETDHIDSQNKIVDNVFENINHEIDENYINKPIPLNEIDKYF